MREHSSSPLLLYLQVAGWAFVVMWGIRAASEVLSILLLALLLAYGFLPLPQWLMQRFGLRKPATFLATSAMLGSLGLFTAFWVYERLQRIKQMLPVYHDRFMALYGNVVSSLNARGIDYASLPASKLSTAAGFVEATRPYYPLAETFLVDGLLVSLLALILVLEMVEQPAGNKNPLAETLGYFGGDIQRYIAICVKTGLITALANLAIFFALGVDFPGLWCILYFFLHFIPNIGFLFALVPPAFMALLMSGWQKALLVVGGLVLTQTLSDYVLTPMLMKKEVHISFLEITVSLLVWGYLLGPAGAILAIPLTMALRRFVQKLSAVGSPAAAPS